MTKREHYTYQIRCPACPAYGQVQASENEDPAAEGGLAFAIDDVSTGFKLTTLGRSASQSRFTCDLCGGAAA